MILLTFYQKNCGNDKKLNEITVTCLEAIVFVLPFLQMNLFSETTNCILNSLLLHFSTVTFSQSIDAERKTRTVLKLISITFKMSCKNLEGLLAHQNPLFIAFQLIYPKYVSLLENTGYDKLFVDSFCEMISNAIQSAEYLFESVLDVVSQQLFKSFKARKTPKPLYVFAELLSLYPNHIPKLLNLLELFAQETFELIQGDFEGNADTVRTFFDTVMQPLFYNPQEFLNSQVLKKTFILLIPCLKIQDLECTAAIYRFSVLFWGEKKESLWLGVREKVLSIVGAQLIPALFDSMLNTSHRVIIYNNSEVLFLILNLEIARKNIQQWLTPVLQNMPLFIQDSHKQHILKVILSCKDKSSLNSFVAVISDVVNQRTTADKLLAF